LLTTRAQQNVSPTAAQTKNCDSPTGKSDSAAPTKNCASPTSNKQFNHASSTKHFPYRFSNKTTTKDQKGTPTAQLQQKNNCARQALNKNKNINHHHHTSSTKNFPHHHSNKKMRKPNAEQKS
jgi:hypothetical protein